MIESAEHVGQSTDTPTSPESSQGFSGNPAPQSELSQQSSAPQITELDKLEKFKYEGREWTPAELKKAILRQQDYTQKMQGFSKERQTFESERKFAENLYADLKHVQNNPALASEFVKVYPQKYHAYLREVLSSTSGTASQQQPQNQNAMNPELIELMSTVNELKGKFTEQEVAKNESFINTTIESLSQKYPDAIQKLVIAEVYDYLQKNPKAQATDAKLWEDTFKSVDAEMKGHWKQRYGEMVKKQTQANAKARDVESGGGTIGQAPQKFKSIRDVTNHAVKQLKDS